MYGCESWTIKKVNAKELILSNCGAGEDYWESLGLQEIKLVSPKGTQTWIFIGRIEADAEVQILLPPDVKNWLTGKDSDVGKGWRQQRGATEEEMVGRHHRLNAHEFEHTLGYSERQGSLVCCSPWGCRVGHNLVTEQQQLQFSYLKTVITKPFSQLSSKI